MADTLTNPYLQMGVANLMAPNKYINPKYADQPLQMPGFYTGQSAGNMPPTDAMGQPIQGFVDNNARLQADYQNQLAAFNAAQPAGGAPTPGTTLNSVPGQAPGQPQVQTSGSWPGQAQGAAAPGSLMATPAMQQMQAGIAAAQAAKTPQQLYTDQQNTAMRNQMLQQQANMSTVQAGNGGFGNMPGGAFNSGSYMPLQSLIPASAPGPAAGAGGPTPPSPPDLRQTYLDALSNPGPVKTQGFFGPSTLPAPLGQSNVLDAFLSANPGGRSGAGNYNNSGFFNTLNQLQGPAAQQGPSLAMAAPSPSAPSMPSLARRSPMLGAA